MESKCTDREVGMMLHAYELGVLGEAEREKFEIHLLTCDACAAEVEAFQAEAVLLREDAGLMDEAEARPERRRAGLQNKLADLLWPSGPWWAKPGLVYLAFILLLYPAYVGLFGSGESSVKRVQSLTLVPMRSGMPVSIACPPGRDLAVTFIYDDVHQDESYRLALVHGERDTVYSAADVAFDDYRAGHILVPHQLVKTGSWHLSIEPAGLADSSRRQEYVFDITH